MFNPEYKIFLEKISLVKVERCSVQIKPQESSKLYPIEDSFHTSHRTVEEERMRLKIFTENKAKVRTGLH